MEAELRLGNGIAGSYLMREGENRPGADYFISLHDGTGISHHLIHNDPKTSKWFCYLPFTFATLPELVIHHSRHRDGFPTELCYPVSNPLKPLTHIHEVDEWEIDCSDITMSQRIYEGKYETYKAFIKSEGKSVFIRPFKEVTLPSRNTHANIAVNGEVLLHTSGVHGWD